MLALIDGDVLVYQCGYTTNDSEQWIARARLRDMIKGILEATGASDYQIYLSDSKGNWRLEYFPAYKGNRTQPKPTHYQYLQQLLVDEWDAEVAMEQEADDALGITQTAATTFIAQDIGFGLAAVKKEGNWYTGPPSTPEATGETIICSIDKDLKQIPGYHYNWDRKEITFISPSEGLYRFYYQLLTGDAGDNITVKQGLSCPGIGPKKAFAALEGCETEMQMFEVCYDLYLRQWEKELGDNYPPEEAEDRLLLTGRMIKIRTRPGEIWQFPQTILS